MLEERKFTEKEGAVGVEIESRNGEREGWFMRQVGEFSGV